MKEYFSKRDVKLNVWKVLRLIFIAHGQQIDTTTKLSNAKDHCNCFPKSQMQSSLKWKENHQNPNQSHIRVYYIKIWHSKITHEHLNIYSKKSVFQIFNQFQISIFSSPRE